MSKQTEALKLALEDVYETIIRWDECGGKRSRRELARRIVALAEQPAQQQDHDCALKRGGIVCRHCDLEIIEASYGPQIARQQDIPDLIAGALGVSRGTAYDMMREALVGAQQQEPVAWRVRWPKMGGGYKWIMNDAPLMAEHGFINEPLYTSPPASKPWVGLTAVEIASASQKNGGAEWWWKDMETFARAIEAKLREKNA